MRLAVVLLSLLSIPFALSQATIHAAGVSRVDSSDLSSRHGGGNDKPKCEGVATRDQTTCACKLPYLIDPGNNKKDCTCPDYPNTQVVNSKKNGPSCVCDQPGQTFNPQTHLCECPAGYKGTRNKKNKLTCELIPQHPPHHPHPPHPTGGTKHHYKKTFEEAVELRKTDEQASFGAVETLLGCKAHEKACEADNNWVCTDVMFNLATCGGCLGESMDCASLPGANEVRCVSGKCMIDSCRRGFSRIENSAQNATTPYECAPRSQTRSKSG